MKKTRTYQVIDLALFALMTVFFEALLVTAGVRWFPAEAYMVSVTPVITAIVMMRWGGWAALHAALGGLVYAVSAGGGGAQLAVYAAGNLLGLTALLLIRFLGGERIRKDAALTAVFGAVTVLGMQAGRAILSLCLGYAPEQALRFITTDVVTLLFTVVLICLVRRLDGVFENQKHYLARIAEEERRERGGIR